MTKAERMNEVEMSKIANDPKFQSQELDNLVTFYEKQLRDTPNDAAHAEERAQLEVMVEHYRKILRGEK